MCTKFSKKRHNSLIKRTKKRNNSSIKKTTKKINHKPTRRREQMEGGAGAAARVSRTAARAIPETRVALTIPKTRVAPKDPIIPLPQSGPRIKKLPVSLQLQNMFKGFKYKPINFKQIMQNLEKYKPKIPEFKLTQREIIENLEKYKPKIPEFKLTQREIIENLEKFKQELQNNIKSIPEGRQQLKQILKSPQHSDLWKRDFAKILERNKKDIVTYIKKTPAKKLFFDFVKFWGEYSKNWMVGEFYKKEVVSITSGRGSLIDLLYRQKDYLIFLLDVFKTWKKFGKLPLILNSRKRQPTLKDLYNGIKILEELEIALKKLIKNKLIKSSIVGTINIKALKFIKDKIKEVSDLIMNITETRNMIEARINEIKNRIIKFKHDKTEQNNSNQSQPDTPIDTPIDNEEEELLNEINSVYQEFNSEIESYMDRIEKLYADRENVLDAIYDTNPEIINANIQDTIRIAVDDIIRRAPIVRRASSGWTTRYE